MSDKANVCSYCGFLAWTIRQHGRITHKHACPNRTESYCQSHPHHCDDPPIRAVLHTREPA